MITITAAIPTTHRRIEIIFLAIFVAFFESPEQTAVFPETTCLQALNVPPLPLVPFVPPSAKAIGDRIIENKIPIIKIIFFIC